MGEYGMTYRDARRVPFREMLLLWKARERRSARAQLEEIEDRYVVSGLQSEVRVEGEKPAKRGKRVIPVALIRRREQLERRGYPRRRKPWTPEREKQKIDAFWASAGVDEMPVVDLATPEPPEDA